MVGRRGQGYGGANRSYGSRALNYGASNFGSSNNFGGSNSFAGSNSYGGTDSFGGGNYQNSNNPWNTSSSNNRQQLNEMALELEVMKRKRQMLQEQRQLLQEQRQLEMLKVQHGSNRYSDGDGFSKMHPWQPVTRRAPKRSAPPIHSEPAKKSMPEPVKYAETSKPKAAKKPIPRNIVSQAEIDVGPVEPPPTDVFVGVKSMTPAMRGRLEFALGHICRQLRDKFLEPPHSVFLSMHQVKLLKINVRKRLHEAMMNKSVESSEQVMEIFRKACPHSDDTIILEEIIKESVVLSKKKFVKPEDPKSEDASKSSEDTKPKPQHLKRNDPKAELSKLIRLHMHDLLREKLDIVFEEMKKIAAEKGPEIFAVRTKESDDAATQEAQVNEKPAQEEAVVKTEASEAKSDEEDLAKLRAEENETNKALEEFLQENTTVEKAFSKLEPLLEKYLGWKMQEVLPRYKNHMIYILSLDPQMQAIGLKEVEKMEEESKQKTLNKLFFAKVLGRPSLPNREVMTRFLRDYNVITIKKHHSIYNLLFVGLPSEEICHKLVAQDGIRIGGRKLSIKLSERNQKDGAKDKESDSQQAAEAAAVTNGDSAEKTDGEKTSDPAVSLNSDIDNVISITDDAQDEAVISVQEPEIVTVEDDEESSEPVTEPEQEQAGEQQEGNQSAETQEVEAAGIKTRRSTRRMH